MSDKSSTGSRETPSLEDRIYAMTINDLKKQWGGRLPTWDEYKKADKDGRVKTNKGVANKALSLPGVPKLYYIMFGLITPWGMFLVPSIAIVLYLFGRGNGWVVLGCILVGVCLYKLTFVGACYGIMKGAKADERLYQILLYNGAFLFEPSKQLSSEPIKRSK
jgi:hypothetical protein